MRVGIAMILTLTAQVALSGQQALFVSPGGLVIFSNNTISTMDGKLSENELTIEHEGKIYPNSGLLFDEMIKQNSQKYNALPHIKIQNNSIMFDDRAIEIGVNVLQVDVALCWGELIACIGDIPHASKHWLEPNTSKALIVFSPMTKIGTFKGLYLGEKASCRIWLLDPIHSDATSRHGIAPGVGPSH